MFLAPARRSRPVPLALLLTALVGAVTILATLISPEPARAQVPDPNGGSIGIRLLDAPVELKDDPRASLYIIDHLPPGSTITRRVVVSNGTEIPQVIDAYPGPAELKDGAFVPVDEGARNLLTGWISIDPPVLHLEPGAEAEAVVTISVPADAPEMEQYAAIWASHSTNRDGEGFNQVSRTGVRVYLSVGEGNGPPSDFVIGSLAPGRLPGGLASVTASVTNTGGRAVDVTGELQLTGGPGGLNTEPVEAPYTTIGPGETQDVVFQLPASEGLPNGPWEATVALESGVHGHDLTAELTFPEEGQGEAVTETSRPWGWIIGGGIAMVALLALTWWFLLGRREPDHADG